MVGTNTETISIGTASAVSVPAPLQTPAPILSPKRKKIRASTLFKSFLRRAISPAHLAKAVRTQITYRRLPQSFDDAQLALYAQILPTDFLHYGYFQDPSRQPMDTSLNDIAAAQTAYADLILSHVDNRTQPVLDVGCGMGGLSRLLLERGFTPVALTPDRVQAAHVKKTLPEIEVLRCKLEQLPAADHTAKFGTIITAESLQYLKLDFALPILSQIIQPGGTWVACDYFLNASTGDRSCHVWQTFTEKLQAHGWQIQHQQDITANVLPTLAYAHMWMARLGQPLMKFAFLKFRRKQPALHHLLGGTMDILTGAMDRTADRMDPEKFLREKRYLLLTMTTR